MKQMCIYWNAHFMFIWAHKILKLRLYLYYTLSLSQQIVFVYCLVYFWLHTLVVRYETVQDHRTLASRNKWIMDYFGHDSQAYELCWWLFSAVCIAVWVMSCLCYPILQHNNMNCKECVLLYSSEKYFLY